jgi:hypothetical protein
LLTDMKAYVGLFAVVGALLACDTVRDRLTGKTAGSASAAAQSAPGAAPLRDPKVHAAPDTFTPVPWKVGQWTRHRITESNGRSSTLTYKIVSEQDGAHWIEVVTGAANAGTVLQILMRLTDRTKPEQGEILGAKIKMPNGGVKKLEGAVLAAASAGYKKSLRHLSLPSLAGLPRETVTVPAGTFRGCFKFSDTTAVAGLELKSTVWSHPDVPISSLVKNQSEDGSTFLELLDYGLSGAKSEM